MAGASAARGSQDRSSGAILPRMVDSFANRGGLVRHLWCQFGIAPHLIEEVSYFSEHSLDPLGAIYQGPPHECADADDYPPFDRHGQLSIERLASWLSHFLGKG